MLFKCEFLQDTLLIKLHNFNSVIFYYTCRSQTSLFNRKLVTTKEVLPQIFNFTFILHNKLHYKEKNYTLLLQDLQDLMYDMLCNVYQKLIK